MEVNFALEASSGVIDKVRIINNYKNQFDDFFRSRNYSNDLKCLSILIFCLSPKMEPLFPSRPPIYNTKARNYMYRGERLEKIAGTLEYELRLDYSLYDQLSEIGGQLANDILLSLDAISACENIKNLKSELMRKDFRLIFQEIGWI